MKKSWNSAIRTYKTVWSVDRFFFLYTIVYNLLKQFFNVFYSVYFLRTLLAYIENGQSVLRIVALLLFMACVEIVFYHLDNHLKQVYFVNFETKLKENVNENIFHAARNAGYEVFCDPKFLNQYRQVLDNTAAKMAGIVQASGAACGLCFALGLVLVYLVKVDLGAILFCLFSLVYSFLAGSIGEKIKYTFNHATTMAAPHFRCAWAICQTRSQFFSRMDFLLNVFGSLSSCRRKPRRIRRKSGIKFLFGSWR